MISIIVAASSNGVIGRDGDLPWHLSDDLKRFKALTLGKPVIMGRLTYESIGRPLPDRRNIVITRNADYAAPGCDVVMTTDEALELVAGEPEVMIIGGGQVYDALRGHCDRIYLTRVHTTIDGDTVFREPDPENWQRLSSEHHPVDDRHDYAFDFEVYERN